MNETIYWEADSVRSCRTDVRAAPVSCWSAPKWAQLCGVFSLWPPRWFPTCEDLSWEMNRPGVSLEVLPVPVATPNSALKSGRATGNSSDWLKRNRWTTGGRMVWTHLCAAVRKHKQVLTVGWQPRGWSAPPPEFWVVVGELTAVTCPGVSHHSPQITPLTCFKHTPLIVVWLLELLLASACHVMCLWFPGDAETVPLV